jgi:hypothetical protein
MVVVMHVGRQLARTTLGKKWLILKKNGKWRGSAYINHFLLNMIVANIYIGETYNETLVDTVYVPV